MPRLARIVTTKSHDDDLIFNAIISRPGGYQATGEMIVLLVPL